VYVFCGGGRERKVANGGLRGGAGGCGEREMRGKKRIGIKGSLSLNLK